MLHGDRSATGFEGRGACQVIAPGTAPSEFADNAPGVRTLSPSESTGLLTSARTLCLPTEHYEVVLSFFHVLLKPPSRPVDERLHLCRRDVEEIPPG
jgi:hypothetical protein